MLRCIALLFMVEESPPLIRVREIDMALLLTDSTRYCILSVPSQIVQLVCLREDGMKERRRHDNHRLQGYEADIRTGCG